MDAEARRVGPRGKASRHRLRVTWAALVLSASVGIWLGLREPELARIPLLTGGVFTLRGLSYSGQRVVVGSPLRQFAYTLLPDDWKDRTGCRLLMGRTGEFELCLDRSPGVAPDLAAVAIDEHGCELGDVDLESGGIEHFPRRGRCVGLRFYRTRPNGVEGEFLFANPLQAEHPQWQPERLPVTHKVPGGRLTLASCRWRHPDPDRWPNASPGTIEWDVELKRSGGFVGLFSYGPTLRDATGNEAGETELSIPTGHRCRVRFLAPRFSDERAVKLQICLYRDDHAAFLPSELWHTPELTIPREERQAGLGYGVVRRGVAMRLRKVGGGKSPFVLWSYQSPESDLWPDVIAVYRNGRRLPGNGYTHYTSEPPGLPIDAAGQNVHVVSPEHCGPGDRISLLFAVQRPTVAEFLLPTPGSTELTAAPPAPPPSTGRGPAAP